MPDNPFYYIIYVFLYIIYMNFSRNDILVVENKKPAETIGQVFSFLHLLIETVSSRRRVSSNSSFFLAIISTTRFRAVPLPAFRASITCSTSSFE